MSPLRITFSLIAVIIVIIGAYYATYYVGLKASGQSKGKLRNRNINLIDRFAISKDKGFYLVEISGKVYVIGVTNQSMTLIDTYDAAAFSEAAALSREAANTSAAWGRDSGYQGFDTKQGASYYNTGQGGLKNKLTNRLAAFLTARMGRPYDPYGPDETGRGETSLGGTDTGGTDRGGTGSDPAGNTVNGADGSSFADNMAAAQKNQQDGENVGSF